MTDATSGGQTIFIFFKKGLHDEPRGPKIIIIIMVETGWNLTSTIFRISRAVSYPIDGSPIIGMWAIIGHS